MELVGLCGLLQVAEIFQVVVIGPLSPLSHLQYSKDDVVTTRCGNEGGFLSLVRWSRTV